MAFPEFSWIGDYSLVGAILAHKGFKEVTFKRLNPLLGPVIVNSEGEDHRRRRSLEGRLFVSSLLKKQEQLLIPRVIHFTLEPYLNAGKGCLVEISQSVTSQVGAAVIGLEGFEKKDSPSHLAHLLNALVSGRAVTQPGFRPLTRRQALEELKKNYLEKAISGRRLQVEAFKAGKLNQAELPQDLITLLLLHGESQNWPTQNILGEVAFYAVAAVDTTATLIPHLMHELFQFFRVYPEYQPLKDNLAFIRQAASEALRLHPVLPTIFRQAQGKLEVGGVIFEEGQVVGLQLGKANLNPEIFGVDASKFNPLRVPPARVRRSGFSFGGGTHLCMGRELALGTPEIHILEENEKTPGQLYGEASLLAQALFRAGAKPDPLSLPQKPPRSNRDIFIKYPLRF